MGESWEDFLAKQGPDLVDPRLAKALEHPIRIEILTVLREGPSSPTRIQRELDNVSLNLVAHHVKVLKELGFVELVETVSRRGAKEHIYRVARSPVISDDVFGKLTPKARMPITATVLRLISRDLARSLETGLFDQTPEVHLSRSPLKLDREGWSEVVALLTQTLEEVNEIGSRSSKRLAASDETSTLVTVAIMQFPTDKRAV
ncbi:MAG: winged helix-turn-helix domain-containing protein [Solirubrobacterales bacterium]